MAVILEGLQACPGISHSLHDDRSFERRGKGLSTGQCLEGGGLLCGQMSLEIVLYLFLKLGNHRLQCTGRLCRLLP